MKGPSRPPAGTAGLAEGFRSLLRSLAPSPRPSSSLFLVLSRLAGLGSNTERYPLDAGLFALAAVPDSAVSRVPKRGFWKGPWRISKGLLVPEKPRGTNRKALSRPSVYPVGRPAGSPSGSTRRRAFFRCFCASEGERGGRGAPFLRRFFFSLPLRRAAIAGHS